jgi:glycosyltransferase involved in cell wall biosynthesis
VRIALLPSAYAPAVGGVEVLTARLAARLHDLGHVVEVWTARSSGDRLPHEERIDDITVRRFVFDMPGMEWRSLRRFPVAAASGVRDLRAAQRRFKPSVLHVQCFSGNGAYATVLSRLTGVPLVVSLQGETMMDDDDIYQHSVAMRFALRQGLRRASAVTGCSAFTVDDAVTRFGLDPAKSQVIFNGVDETVDEEPVELRFRRYVFAVGRVVRKKGFDLLVDAFARVADRHPDVGLVIGGDGAERQELQARVRELGLYDRVVFPGLLTQAEVASLMRQAEVFVLPSRVEPFGIVALEAWRAGTATIVSSRGGAGEFVEDGVSGLVCDPLNADELSAAIGSLLDSPERRRALELGAKQRLPQFYWSTIADRYQDSYRRVARS